MTTSPWPQAPLWMRIRHLFCETLKLAGLWRISYDIDTFTARGLTCASCGRLSHCERTHLTHRCSR